MVFTPAKFSVLEFLEALGNNEADSCDANIR